MMKRYLNIRAFSTVHTDAWRLSSLLDVYCIQTPKSPKGFERKEKRNQATASDSIKNPTVDKILRHCQYFLLNFPFGNFQMCCVSSEKQKYANGVYPKNNKNKNSRRQSLVHIQQSVLVILSVCVSDFL